MAEVKLTLARLEQAVKRIRERADSHEIEDDLVIWVSDDGKRPYMVIRQCSEYKAGRPIYERLYQNWDYYRV